jgi:hypothetical protein
MRSRVIGLLGLSMVVAFAPGPVGAWGHANRFGGSEHTNIYGGSTAGRAGAGAEHTNVSGGTTVGRYGEGAYHETRYGATVYHPPASGTYGYHPPATVNYYGADCHNCGGWAVAGAAASAANSANTAAATTAAYDAGTARTASYTMGAIYPKLPAGCAKPTVQGKTYYLCGNTWFQPSYGANGVSYHVVPTP